MSAFQLLILGGLGAGGYWLWRQEQERRAAELAALEAQLAAAQDTDDPDWRDAVEDGLKQWGAEQLVSGLSGKGVLGGLFSRFGLDFNRGSDDGGGGGSSSDFSAPGWSLPSFAPAIRPTPRPTTPDRSPVSSGGRGTAGLRDLIGSVEAPKGYDQVYGGIRSADLPPKRLTSMTVGEVLAWQDSIDPRYPSEAAGRYQVMEDTLRGLVRSGKVRTTDRFDARGQDRIADLLLERRGLSSYQSGRISDREFAQRLSQEWASFPAAIRDRKGRPATGQSYYAGDGLNRSHLTLDRVLAEIARI